MAVILRRARSASDKSTVPIWLVANKEAGGIRVRGARFVGLGKNSGDLGFDVACGGSQCFLIRS